MPTVQWVLWIRRFDVAQAHTVDATSCDVSRIPSDLALGIRP
ncbi:hypothetical protein [Pseudomonas frederiksbergensis]|nr:hypothetical protein [Pseudomonas frederiksbergensis]